MDFIVTSRNTLEAFENMSLQTSPPRKRHRITKMQQTLDILILSTLAGCSICNFQTLNFHTKLYYVLEQALTALKSSISFRTGDAYQWHLRNL